MNVLWLATAFATAVANCATVCADCARFDVARDDSSAKTSAFVSRVVMSRLEFESVEPEPLAASPPGAGIDAHPPGPVGARHTHCE